MVIAAAGLEMAGSHCIKPRYGKAVDRDDPLLVARSNENTTLWWLKAGA